MTRRKIIGVLVMCLVLGAIQVSIATQPKSPTVFEGEIRDSDINVTKLDEGYKICLCNNLWSSKLNVFFDGVYQGVISPGPTWACFTVGYKVGHVVVSTAEGSFDEGRAWHKYLTQEGQNHPPKASRVDPSNEGVLLAEAGVNVTFKVQTTDEDTSPDMNLHMIQWFVDNQWKETDPVDGTIGTGEFTYTFDEEGTYYVKAIVYDEKMKELSVIWQVILSPTKQDVFEGYVYIEQKSYEFPSGSGLCQGTPLEGAQVDVVDIPGLSTRTDSDGHFKIELLTGSSQNAYGIRASRRYYQTQTREWGTGSLPGCIRLKFKPEFKVPESSWWNHRTFSASDLKSEFPDAYDDLASRDSHPILGAEWKFVGNTEKHREDIEIFSITAIVYITEAISIGKAAWAGKFAGGAVQGVQEFLGHVGWSVLKNLVSPEGFVTDLIIHWDEWPNYAELESPDGNTYLLFITTKWPDQTSIDVISYTALMHYEVSKTYLCYLTEMGWKFRAVTISYKQVENAPED